MASHVELHAQVLKKLAARKKAAAVKAKSSGAAAAAAAAEAKKRASKKGKAKDKSTFNQVRSRDAECSGRACARTAQDGGCANSGEHDGVQGWCARGISGVSW